MTVLALFFMVIWYVTQAKLNSFIMDVYSVMRSNTKPRNIREAKISWEMHDKLLRRAFCKAMWGYKRKTIKDAKKAAKAFAEDVS